MSATPCPVAAAWHLPEGSVQCWDHMATTPDLATIRQAYVTYADYEAEGAKLAKLPRLHDYWKRS